MNSHLVLSIIFAIGFLIDIIAAICMIRYEFGYSFNKKNVVTPYTCRGVPAGPIFYILGLLQLAFINKVPFSVMLTVFVCCMLFYLLIVFSPVIASQCVKLLRRFKSHSRQVFYSGNGMNPIDTINQALAYLIHSDGNEQSGSGVVYFHSCRPFTQIIVHVPGSDKILITTGEWEPGEIALGSFANDIEQYGFTKVRQWSTDGRNRTIVPACDFSAIPTFIDTLLTKYYRCGHNYHLKAEVFKICN